MKIVMTGGGSGGHITPILAVAHELRQARPDCRLVYIGQRQDAFGAVVGAHQLIDECYSVSAGKFRRYHGEGWRQLRDLRTIALNVRDLFRVAAGLLQSIVLLRRLRPDCVFSKGGFVGVPVGLAAALLRIPYITHDSDATAGLANRIIARWARAHAVALEAQLYPYDSAKTVTVGVPVAPEYVYVDSGRMHEYRRMAELEQYEQVVVITGGGLGAQRVNQAMTAHAGRLLTQYPRLCLVHLAGAAHLTAVTAAYDAALPEPAQRQRVRVLGFSDQLYCYTGAADVVVARGGATNFAELAVQGKACVIVPNPLLTGGHQLKNAAAYVEQHAIVCVTEAEEAAAPGRVVTAVAELLAAPEERTRLGQALHAFAKPEAAAAVARLLLAQANAATPNISKPSVS